MGLVLFTLPLLGAVTLGESIAVLGTIASFLLNQPHQQQPTFKAMTSCWGDPWPITFNSFRVAGKVIQASQVQEHSGKKSKKGGPTFSQTIAIGFAEGPRTMGRIWADGHVIYDPRPITAADTWTANTTYGAGDTVLPTAGGDWIFTATVNGDSGVSEPSWNSSADAATADGTQVWIAGPYVPRTFIGKEYNFDLRVYNGDEDQLPDSALEELVGVGNQSAYRGLVYIVLEDFDLSKYGNRIPNFEAEMLPDPSAPYQFSQDDELFGTPFRQMSSDPNGEFGYFWAHPDVTLDSYCIVKVSLSSGTVVAVSDPFNAPYGADTGFSPPIATLTGGKCWMLMDDFVTSDTLLVAVDSTTLAVTDTINLGSAINPLFPCTMNADGSLVAMINYPGGSVQELVLVDTTSAPITRMSRTDLSTVGGPASSAVSGFYTPQFDDQDRAWFFDDHGQFWSFDCQGGVVPIVSNGQSYFGRVDDGALYGSIVFNPDDRNLYAWTQLLSGAFDMIALPFNVDTLTAGTEMTVTDSSQMWVVIGDTLGWHRGRYAAVFVGDGSGGVGRFDYQTGTTDIFDWSFWGLAWPGPTIGTFYSAAIAADGRGIVTLNSQGGGLPTYFDCWFFPTDPAVMTLEDICIDISERVGLAGKYDFTEFATVIPRGAAVLNRQKAREFLEAIMPAFFFDMTDIGPQVVGTLRENSTLVATIPEDDLGAATDPNAQLDKIMSTRSADLEIPRDMAVSYYDYNHDYQAGSQPDRRSAITQYSSGSNSMTIPVVMTPGEAANVASRVLYQIWIERTPRKASVPLDYIYVTPSDLVDLVRDGEAYRIRVTKARFNPSQVIDLEGVSEDIGVYSLTAGNPLADISTGSYSSQTVDPVAPPVLAIMDTAVLRESDLQEIGIYAAGAPETFNGKFSGESVQASVDNSIYNQEGVITTKSTMGLAASVLASVARHTLWDRVNTIDVTLYDGQFGSASEADVINLLTNLVWTESGEIIQFKTATALGGHVYRLSVLLRGRYGTEAFMGDHFMGEKVVFIDTASGADIVYGASRIDQAIYWKGVNDSPTTRETTPELLTMTTRRLMPFAPYYMQGARDMSSNLTITGLRRMRWRGRPLWTPPETDTPVAMEIDIYNGLSVVRTLTATLSGGGSGITDPSSFEAYYSAADQVTDFGSTQAAVSIIAYQLNAVVGRGYGGDETV